MKCFALDPYGNINLMWSTPQKTTVALKGNGKSQSTQETIAHEREAQKKRGILPEKVLLTSNQHPCHIWYLPFPTFFVRLSFSCLLCDLLLPVALQGHHRKALLLSFIAILQGPLAHTDSTRLSLFITSASHRTANATVICQCDPSFVYRATREIQVAYLHVLWSSSRHCLLSNNSQGGVSWQLHRVEQRAESCNTAFRD